MKVRDVLRTIYEDGWLLRNSEGIHRQFVHPTKPGKVTVNKYPGEEVAKGTRNSIMKQAGLKKWADTQ
jgi:predicted RNA binding protein YcfA (HicA-like mRNA interferase family)